MKTSTHLGDTSIQRINSLKGENSGSVKGCLTQDQEVAGLSLTDVTVLCPRARHIYPCLVLVQPRKSVLTLLKNCRLGCKESNQTNKFFEEFIDNVYLNLNSTFGLD